VLTRILYLTAAILALAQPAEAQLWSGMTTLGDFDYTGLCHARVNADPSKQLVVHFGYHRTTGAPIYGVSLGDNSTTQFDAPIYVVSNGQALGGTFRPATMTQAGDVSVRWGSAVDGNETPFDRDLIGTIYLSWDTHLIKAITRTRLVSGTGGAVAPNPLMNYFSSGWYWNPNEPGTGYCLEIQADTAFVGIMAGDGSWAFTSGPMTSRGLYTGSLQKCGRSGGNVVCTDQGTISLTFREVLAPTTNAVISQHIDVRLPNGFTTTLEKF